MHVTFTCKAARYMDPSYLSGLCEKAVLKSGVTKNWKITETEQGVSVDIGAAYPPVAFTVTGKKPVIALDYTADIPAGEKEIHDKKSLVFALMKMLYKVRDGRKEYSVTDDCGAWIAFLTEMKYQAPMRELTEKELARVQRAYDSGVKEPLPMLVKFLSEDLELTPGETLEKRCRENLTMYSAGGFPGVDPDWVNILEMWAYETCTWRGKRIPCLDESERLALDAFTLELAGFILTGEQLVDYLSRGTYPGTERIFGVPHGVTARMLRSEFLPAFEQAEGFERLVLTWRVFVSALEFNRLRFAGIDPVGRH